MRTRKKKCEISSPVVEKVVKLNTNTGKPVNENQGVKKKETK